MIVGIIAFGYMLTATNHKVIPSVMLARCAMNAIDLSTAGRGILHDGCKYPSPACAIVRDCLCRAPHEAATYPMAYWCVCRGMSIRRCSLQSSCAHPPDVRICAETVHVYAETGRICAGSATGVHGTGRLTFSARVSAQHLLCIGWSHP